MRPFRIPFAVRRASVRALAALAVVATLAVPAPRAGADDFLREPINYATAPADNAVTRLEARLAGGKAKLEYERHFGYLRSVLRELGVPESSQTLVFSKTSLQRDRIGPRTPRALYFSDDAYVGFCRAGEVMEVTAVDPALGAVFYTLDQQRAEKPRFVRQTDNCLSCHGSSQTRGIPGHLVRSVFPDAAGLPILSAGSFRVDHTTPLENRWGGWYVTGTHGKQTHLGNLVVNGREVSRPVDNAAGLNLTALGDRVRAGAYLTPHSDLVALMVLEHQAEGQNLIARLGFQTRIALHQEAALNRELGKAAGERWESTRSRIKSAADPLVKYLLFAGEAPLTSRLHGTSAFAEEFARQGPRDPAGRSLRDLDLGRRLFKHPCSYLICSPQFDALPADAREYVLEKVWNILNNLDASADYDHLTADDRRAIVQILAATKPNLPDYWRQAMRPGKE